MVRRVRRDIDETLGTYTDDLIATRTTHFVGSYWRVWPAVFHFKLALYERGGSARLFGITHRSRPTADLWLTAPAWRVAAARTEDEILWWSRGYGLPFLAPRGIVGSIRLGIRRGRSSAVRLSDAAAKSRGHGGLTGPFPRRRPCA